MNERACRQCGRSVDTAIDRCPYCGTTAPTDQLIGRTLRNNILIQNLIARGSMGTVYRAVETHLSRPIAIKVLNQFNGDNERLAEYFMREAAVLSQLRHPNLISVLDFGQEDGLLYLAMEFVPGRSLADIIDSSAPIPIPRALHIMLQILSALEVVHQRGVIHRDLKPENILLEDIAGTEDFVKVLDFGVATIVETSDRLTSPEHPTVQESFTGTPRYMSPEQAMSLDLDARCDIYAAGIILYEMLTGELPHASDDPIDMLVRRISEDVEPPDKLKPDLSIHKSVSRITCRALSRDREARYAQVNEFREELEQAMAHMRIDFSGLRPGTDDLAWAVNQSLQSGIRMALASSNSLPRPSARFISSELSQSVSLLDPGAPPPISQPPPHSDANLTPDPDASHDPDGLLVSDLQAALQASQDVDLEPRSELGDGPHSDAEPRPPSLVGARRSSSRQPILHPLPGASASPTATTTPTHGSNSLPRPSIEADDDPLEQPVSARDALPAPPAPPLADELASPLELASSIQARPESLKRALALVGDVPTQEAETVSIILIRLQLGEHASADATTNNLYRVVWSGLMEMIESPDVTTRVLVRDMGILASKGPPHTMMELALRLRDQATRRYPFARFAFAVNNGLVEFGDDDEVTGPAIDDGLSILTNVVGNQIIISARLESLLQKRFVTVEAFGGCRFVLRRAPENGVTYTPSAINRAAAREARFVGRAPERERLEELLGSIHTGKRGAPVLITGEEGLGKTHMVRFVRTMAQMIGLPVLESYSHNRLLDRPFRPLLNLVAQACGRDTDTLPEPPRLDSLYHGLRLMGLNEQDVQALVGQFISGTRFDQHNLSQLARERVLSYPRLCGAIEQFPPEERLRVMVGSLSHLLNRITESGGAVVIIEDIHQSDASSVQALPTLCELTRHRPLLLICTSLTNDIPGLEHFEAMPIQPLAPGKEREQFWEALQEHRRGFEPGSLSSPPIPAEALASSEGTPLYAAMWFDPAPPPTTPESVKALIVARFEALPKRLQRLMMITSTLGEYFEKRELEGLFPQSNTLLVALKEAEALGLLEPCPATPSLWRFRNPLVRRTIYHMIPRPERTRYHSSIHQALALQPNLTERVRLLLATHADRATMRAEAMDSAELLGDSFAVAGDPRVGEYWYFRGLEAAQRSLRSGIDLDRGDLTEYLLKTIEIALRSGHTRQAFKLLNQLQPNDDKQRLYAAMLRARIMLTVENYDQAAEALHPKALPDMKRDPALLALYQIMAQILLAQGLPKKALTTLYSGLELIRKIRDDIPPHQAHLEWTTFTLYSDISIEQGDLDVGEKILMTCFRRALELGNGLGVCQVLESLGRYLLQQNRASELVDVCDLILAASHLALRLTQRVHIDLWMGRAQRAVGNEAKAQEHFQQALDQARAMGWGDLVTRATAELKQLKAS